MEVLQARYQVSTRRSCEVIQLARSTLYYASVADDQAFLRMRIKELSQVRIGWGYRRLHILLRREGWRVNHKRVYRLYTQEGLTLRRKRPKRHVSSVKRVVRPPAEHLNHSWSMDFMADTQFDGQKLRVLTIVDNFNRESLAIEPGYRFKGMQVAEVLSRIIRERGKPPKYLGGQWNGVHLQSNGSMGLLEQGSTGLFQTR